MKRTFIAIALSLAAAQAGAQTTTNSQANTTSTTTSAAQNAGNAQSIMFNSAPAPSSQTIRTTGQAFLPGFSGSFSSDSCPSTGGVALGGPGASASIAGPVRDRPCVVFRGVERTMQVAASMRTHDTAKADKLDQAAIDMLCNVADEVGAALRHQGLCSIIYNAMADGTVFTAQRSTEYMP